MAKRPYTITDIERSPNLSKSQKSELKKQLAEPEALTRQMQKLAPFKEPIQLHREGRALFAGDTQAAASKPLRLSSRELLDIAEGRPPKGSQTRVTDFSSWVHRLYDPKVRPLSLLHGAMFEDFLRQVRREEWREDVLTKARQTGWRLLHDGMSGSQAAAFAIPSLDVGYGPLYGSPDLVFQDERTSEVLIVEIKTTDAAIPLGGWPDVRAQLWCYAQIPAFQQAKRIELCASFWHFSSLSCYRRLNLVWPATDDGFQAEIQALFSLYRDHVSRSIQRRISADQRRAASGQRGDA